MRTRPTVNLLRGLWAFFCLCFSSCVWAAEGSVETKFFPEAVVADGASTVTITVTVRDRNGSNVPDGTRVVLETTLGSLRQTSLSTVNGVVQTQLTPGTLPGLAVITVSVVDFRASARYSFPFVRNRAELQQAQETLEIRARNRITYAPTERLFRADGMVRVVYRNLDIRADDLQLRADDLELRATNVLVRVGGEERRYRAVILDLRTLSGRALVDRPRNRIVYRPRPPLFDVEVLRETRPRLVELESWGEKDSNQPAILPLKFTDIINVSTLIYAKRAVVLPGREVQMNQATVDVDGAKLFSLPLFRLNMSQRSQVITDEFIQVSNNQIAVDFPYYLTLGTGDEQLLRLRYGTRFARGVGGSGGLFLDFEKAWDTTTESRGGFNVRGLLRNDWAIGIRQSIRPADRTRAYAQLDSVATRTLFGNAFVEQLFSGWRLTYNLGGNSNLRGPRFRSLDQTASATLNPLPLAGGKASATLGISASQREFSSSSRGEVQRSVGSDLFLAAFPQRTGLGTLSATGRLSYLKGQNVRDGVTTSSTLNLTNQSGALGWSFGYEFSDDPFQADFLGKHRLITSLRWDLSPVYLDLYATRGLDLTRLNLQLDGSYRFSSLWRLGGGLTEERFAGSRYTDSSIFIAYNTGLREVGLSWSLRTRRLGVELLGTPIR